MPEHFLSLAGVTVGYGRGAARSLALRNVTLSFRRGKLTLVMGPSGSGKTTLLSLIGCLLAPDAGSVYVGGRDVAALGVKDRATVRRAQIGFVFQAFRLFRALSALDNVAIAGEIGGSPIARAAARDLLEEFGLGGKLALKPDELSGGEKQRVAIARALLRRPPILLADEPTAALDSEAGRQVLEILAGLAEQQNQTVVVVSHDPRWESYAHSVVELRDGEVVACRTSKL